MGKISRDEFRNLARAAADLQQLPLYIDATPALSIAALRTRARRLKRQRVIGMIVVDYLQLLQGSSRQASENRVNEISEITRGLKRSEEHTYELQPLMRISYAVFCLKKKKQQN